MTSIQSLSSHRWRVPARSLSVFTSDGVHIEGTRLGAPGTGRPAMVLCHGLMGWHRKPRFAEFAETLTAWFTVYAFDFRGHGRSGGVCDYGGAEINDIEAIAAVARRVGHDKIVTCGMSMGAIAVLRHAGLLGGADAVVGISSLAHWDWHDGAHPRAREKMRQRIGTRPGRAALRAWGVRLPVDWTEPESPEEVVGKIAPTPVLIVHGADDHLFGVDHAERLLEAAGEPKKLLLGDRFGHAEDGLSSAFGERLARASFEMLEVPWSK